MRARRRAELRERRTVRTARHRPRWLPAAGAAVLVLLIGVPLLLAFGPVFPVRTIAVTGASGAVDRAVHDALRGQLGRPVAQVGEQDVARALAAVPAVERFTLVRRPPSTLEIAVVPRIAVLQQRTVDGWSVLDAAGVRIRSAAAPVPGLPTLTIPAGSERPAQAYAAAVSAVQALSGSSPVVSVVRATSADDVVLELDSGPLVRWGGAEDGAAKAQALRAALRSAARGATEVDVSSPGVVLTR